MYVRSDLVSPYKIFIPSIVDLNEDLLTHVVLLLST